MPAFFNGPGTSAAVAALVALAAAGSRALSGVACGLTLP